MFELIPNWIMDAIRNFKTKRRNSRARDERWRANLGI